MTYQAPDAAHQTNEVVVAVFVDQDTAEQAIAELREAGINDDEIVVSEQPDGAEQVVEHPGLTPGKGALQGSVSGGIVGGTLAVLGYLLLPGVGPVVAGGMLGAMLAGGALGSVAGSLIGALVTRFAVGHHEPGERGGGTLVTVLTDGGSLDARTILGLLWKKKERRNRPSFDYFGPERRWAGL